MLGLVIRPPRSQYPSDSDITLTQTYGGIPCKRMNFLIKNEKNENLQCCLTTPANVEEGTKRPCVVYMHGNAGNKHEGNSYADVLLPLGLDLLAFDFSGCGNSEGQWVTLGWKEKDDLKAVLKHLNTLGKTSKVALWGRSMGGTTALMFDREQSPLPITSMVVDSAFADFSDVATNLVVSKMGVP